MVSCFGSAKHFHFENIWLKFDGYLDTVKAAWTCPYTNANPFRILEYKLQNTAIALKQWSSKHVRSIRLQLAIAKEIVYQLDLAQEHRQLNEGELFMRKDMKLKCLGLASLKHTIERQSCCLTFLAEGDTNTRFFHLQACHRRRRNLIETMRINEHEVVTEEAKADAFFEHFNSILGESSPRTVSLNFEELQLPSLQLDALDHCFSEEEVWKALLDIPVDKAPGPNGFTGLFYRSAWLVI